MSLLKQHAAIYKLLQNKKISQDKYKEMKEKFLPTPVQYDGTLVNISKTPKNTEWYIDERVKDNKVSEAEKMIAGILDGYRIKYHQEVSMKGLQLPTKGYARYDFLLEIDRPYLLIEYDSVLHHSTDYHHQRDALKTKWCRDMNIPLIRYTSKHYYSMDDIIANLMKEYKIRKK